MGALPSGARAQEDFFNAINPFAKHETHLPGVRRPALEQDEALRAPDAAHIQPVAVPPPVPFEEWPNPGGPATNAPPNVAIASGTKTAWSVPNASAAERISSSPLISGGKVLIYSPRRVTAFDLASGLRVWSAALVKGEGASAPGGGIASDGQSVYAISSLRILTALDLANGRVLWSKDLAEPPRSAPTVDDGRIISVSTGGVVSAFSTLDGKELWRYTGLAGLGGLAAATSPAIRGKLVIVPFASGELFGINAETGAPLWSGSLINPNEVSGVSVLSDVAARPVINGKTVYAGSLSGRFVAVEIETGRKLWEKNITTASTPVVAGNGVFVLTLSGEIYALDTATGAVRFAVSLPSEKARNVWMGPVLAGSTLWLGSSTGKLAGIDAATGLGIAQKDLKQGVALSPIAAGGKLIVATQGGGLIALQ